jgi:hypothetical protein
MLTHPYELDEDLIDWDRGHIRFIDEATDDRGNKFHLVRYTATDGINRLCALYNDDPSPEDVTEWCASSCGMTYNAYIGKPWLD